MAEAISLDFRAVGAERVTSAFKQIHGSTTGFQKGIGPIGSALKSLGSAATSVLAPLSMMGNIITGVRNAFGMVVGAIKMTVGAVIDLGTLGGLIVDVRSAFKGLTSAMGESADVMLTRVREALDGTVGDLEIMRTLNVAMQLGIKGSSEEMAELADTAQRLGKAVGRGPVLAFQDLITGIGRQSRMILDNLGIIVDTEAAYDVFAATLGKTSAELTEAEKKQAFFNAVMEQGRKTVADMGEEQLTATDYVSQLKVAFGDLKQAIAETIATSPAFKGLIDSLIAQVKRVIAWLSENSEFITAFIADVFTLVGDLAQMFVTVLLPAIKLIIGAIKVAMAIASPFIKLVSAIFGGGGPALPTPTPPALPSAVQPVVNIEPVINVAVTQTGTATRESIDRAFGDAREAVFSRLGEVDNAIENQGMRFQQEVKNKLYR